MGREILQSMQRDMNISKYNGESDKEFENRLLYSAIIQWLRFFILDESTPYLEKKSKAYLYRRTKSLMETLMEAFPSFAQWVRTDIEDNQDIDDIIHDLRDKMLGAGEWIKVDQNGYIGLPTYEMAAAIPGWGRIVGLSNRKENAICCGVTRILRSNVMNEQKSLDFLKLFDLDDYLDWIEKRIVWNSTAEINQYEFFDPYSSRPPYQSWNNHYPNTNMVLARISLFNGLHEYYLIKKSKDGYLVGPLPSVLAEAKEERRIILALRKAVDNVMQGRAEVKGNAILLDLFCGLPLKEQTVMDTYCWPKRSMMDKYHYVVPTIVWSDIRSLLQDNLGIKVQEK